MRERGRRGRRAADRGNGASKSTPRARATRPRSRTSRAPRVSSRPCSTWTYSLRPRAIRPPWNPEVPATTKVRWEGVREKGGASASREVTVEVRFPGARVGTVRPSRRAGAPPWCPGLSGPGRSGAEVEAFSDLTYLPARLAALHLQTRRLLVTSLITLRRALFPGRARSFPGFFLFLVLCTRAPRRWTSPKFDVSTFATRSAGTPSRDKMKQRERATREGVDGETR